MFDTSEIGIICPSCGKETVKTVAWLQSHKQMTCPACGMPFDIDADQFKRTPAATEKQVADLPRQHSGRFK